MVCTGQYLHLHNRQLIHCVRRKAIHAKISSNFHGLLLLNGYVHVHSFAKINDIMITELVIMGVKLCLST